MIENIFIGAKARKDYELVVHWMVNNGTIRTICIDLSSLSDMCWILDGLQRIPMEWSSSQKGV